MLCAVYLFCFCFFFLGITANSLNPAEPNKMKQAGKKAEIHHRACYKFSEYLFQGNKVTLFQGIPFSEG